jgi:signal transduction histidine kinase
MTDQSLTPAPASAPVVPARASLRWQVSAPLMAWGILQAAAAVWAVHSVQSSSLPLLIAMAAGGPLIGMWAAGRIAARAGALAQAAHELASGHPVARAPHTLPDELGAVGAALNRYADSAQARLDDLRAQNRTRRHEVARLSAALAAVPDGLIVLDGDGQVLLMNAPARQMLGASLSATDLTALTALVTDKLAEALSPSVYALGDSLRIELDGRTLQTQVSAVLTGEDVRIGTLVALRDVSEQARRERARAEALADFEPLLSGIAPAYAQPLRAWGAHLRRLDEDNALHVVRQTDIFAVEALVWGVANAWGQTAKTLHIDLQVDIKARGLRVQGDAKRLHWALGAVVDNALKYTPAGGQVMMQVKEPEDGEYLTIRIRDNGVGIKRDELPHVFTRFYRGTPQTPDGRPLKTAGAGQGLTLARQVIEAHGGSIDVKSRPGSGTAVYIRLPLVMD